MGKTYRKHLAPTEYRKRGKPNAGKPILKSSKQTRPNKRAALRKEYL